jgi:diguanylate cyclase (GGDEF)-like protein
MTITGTTPETPVLKLVARHPAALHPPQRHHRTVGRRGVFIIAPVAAQEQAVTLAQRVRTLTESSWIDTENGTLGVTLSIGIAMIRDRESAAALVKRADIAMFTAKTTGRNRTACG